MCIVGKLDRPATLPVEMIHPVNFHQTTKSRIGVTQPDVCEGHTAKR